MDEMNSQKQEEPLPLPPILIPISGSRAIVAIYRKHWNAFIVWRERRLLEQDIPINLNFGCWALSDYLKESKQRSNSLANYCIRKILNAIVSTHAHYRNYSITEGTCKILRDRYYEPHMRRYGTRLYRAQALTLLYRDVVLVCKM